MRLLVLDLDGTLWDHEDASQLEPPYHFSDDCLTDSKGERLCLFPGVRDFLKWASKRFLLSIASWNVEEKVRPILEGFDLWDYFLFPKIENHPNKGDMILRIIEELHSIGYKVEDIIYVDDRDIHVDNVKMAVPGVDFIHMWVDVKSFEELKQLLKMMG
ncbi:magnesium-dependent phosphatase-1 [Thermococcus sp.]